MLDLDVPKAVFHNEVLPSSEIQKQFMQSFMERADRIRSGGVDSSVDNMLSITNDGRSLALDQRLLNRDLPESEHSKALACAKNVVSVGNGENPTCPAWISAGTGAQKAAYDCCCC